MILKGVSVCQATAGPCGDAQLEQPPTNRSGGDERSNEDSRDSEMRSLEGGADE